MLKGKESASSAVYLAKRSICDTFLVEGFPCGDEGCTSHQLPFQLFNHGAVRGGGVGGWRCIVKPTELLP